MSSLIKKPIEIKPVGFFPSLHSIAGTSADVYNIIQTELVLHSSKSDFFADAGVSGL